MMTNRSPRRKPKPVDIDEVLESTGPWGRFQIYYQIFFMVLVMVIGYQGVLTHFIGSNPPWPCHRHKNITVCQRIIRTKFSLEEGGRKDMSPFSQPCFKINRSRWTNATLKKHSSVTEFDYVCDELSITILTTATFYLGGIIGCTLSGIIADMYGRRRVLMISVFFVIITSIECSFVSDIWQLSGIQGILGASQISAFTIAFVTLLEFMAPSQRAVSTGLFQAAFCVSKLIVDMMAYMERNWRKLQYYASYPALIPLLILFFTPDSPRWLLCVNRKKKATHVLKTISKQNKHSMSFSLKHLDTYSSRGFGCCNLFINRHVLVVTFVLCFLWTTSALLEYHIIALVSIHLDGNFYKAFALSALADIPGNLAAIYTCSRYGRKTSIFGCLLTCGVLIFVVAFSKSVLAYTAMVRLTMVALAMLVKFLVSIVNNGIVLWTFELFPTTVRTRGMCFCKSWEILGAFAAPLLISVLHNTHPFLPNMVVALMAMVCAVTCLVLPETNNLPTRETLEDFFHKPDGYQVILP